MVELAQFLLQLQDKQIAAEGYLKKVVNYFSDDDDKNRIQASFINYGLVIYDICVSELVHH